MVRATWVVLLFALGACAVEAQPETIDTQGASVTATGRWSAGSFGFTSLDVGQGDAAVVVAPHGCVALLDAGPTGSGKKIKQYLRALGVKKIDFAVISHYHEDHLGGLDEVEQGSDAIPIGTVYDHGDQYASGTFADYEAQFQGRRSAVAVGTSISLCNEVGFEVFASDANGTSTTDENARSVEVKVSFAKLDILVGGDLTSALESGVGNAIGAVDLYKVHHHGSAGSSSASFLAAIKPTVSFISVGANNSYGHPSPAAIQRLATAGTAVWLTQGTGGGTRGDLALVSADGDSYTVTQNSKSAAYASK